MPVRHSLQCSPANAPRRDYVLPKRDARHVAGGRTPTGAVHRLPATPAPRRSGAAVTVARHCRWIRPCTLRDSSVHDDHRTAPRDRRGERPGCMPSSTRYRATGQHSERRTSDLPLVPVSSRTAVGDREWLQRPGEVDVARWVRYSSDAFAGPSTWRAPAGSRLRGHARHRKRSDRRMLSHATPRTVTHRIHARQTSVRT
jgi:hypothetical protein